MAAKVSRKYDPLMKFLREVIANEGMSIKVRMEAAHSLDSIFARHEAAQEKEAIRKERAEARARKEAGLPDEPEEETVEEAPSAEDLKANLERAEIDRVLGRA